MLASQVVGLIDDSKSPLAVGTLCHQVVREDGSPWGYRWGIARKDELLRREK